jgi:hypothetical protein
MRKPTIRRHYSPTTVAAGIGSLVLAWAILAGGSAQSDAQGATNTGIISVEGTDHSVIGDGRLSNGTGAGAAASGSLAGSKIAAAEQRTLSAAGISAGTLAALPDDGPTPYEQFFLELTNRGRADPPAEVARLSSRTWGNTGAPAAPDLNEGLAAGTIPPGARQPLAFNPKLILAARNYSELCLSENKFGHNVGGTNPGQRMTAAGYAFTGGWGWGENVAWSGSTGSFPLTQAVAGNHYELLFIDRNVTGRGHRLNLLNSSFKEVGIGIAAGGNYNGGAGGATYNAVLTTQDFAYSSGNSFLTGVVFTDADGDAFYTPGEGIGSVTITASPVGGGPAFTVNTWASGGYALPLAPGTYSVSATGAFGTFDMGPATISTQNIKRDAKLRATSNAGLSGLGLSAGTLTPPFDTGTTSYGATVSNATVSMTVTPTVSASGATVTVNGVSVASGSASQAISLNAGLNTINTVVTSQDGTTTKTYTLAVTRVDLPSVTTLAVSQVAFSGATLNGTVNPNGLPATARFEYGLTTNYGTLTASQSAGAGTSAVPVQATLTGLSPNTTYHYRLVAIIGSGTEYGMNQTFTTPDNPFSVGAWAERTVVRALPTTVGSVVSIGQLTFTGGTGNIEVAVNASGSGWSVAKRYLIPLRNNLGNGSPPATWLKVLPAQETGPYGVNDFDLDVHVSGATALLRLRTVGSTSVAATARIAMKTFGLQSFTNSSTTTTGVTAPALTVSGNAVDELLGKAGIGVAPAGNAALDINGGDTRGLRLRVRTTAGPPVTGTWSKGTMILDKDGNLYICTAASPTGTAAGTWKKVGAP